MPRNPVDLGREDPNCPAEWHGTMSAYRSKCCCPRAREDNRIYRKRLREQRAEPRRVDCTGTSRRLQALSADGWRWEDLAPHLDVSWQAVQQYAVQVDTYVHITTAEKVRALYERLARTPGPSTICRRRAQAKGWLPPSWWDGLDIDDPADPDAPDPDHIDEVALERVLRKRVGFTELRDAERAALVARLAAKGLTRGQIAYRLGTSGDCVKPFMPKQHDQAQAVAA